MEQKFDYAKAMAALEKMASDAQDPKTPVEDIGAMVKESKTLVKECRDYLRSLRDTIEDNGEDQ
ncbi:MAG: exodeoxyribonuclease VII small subunit [Bacteroidales bacterium]|nr:exodeoxyribonuclease VII small subunit [Bacteroidales bacterium]